MWSGLSWLLLPLLALGTNQVEAYIVGPVQQYRQDHVPVYAYRPELRSFGGTESSWQSDAYEDPSDYSYDDDDEGYTDEPDLDPRGTKVHPKCKSKSRNCKPKMPTTTTTMMPTTTTKPPCPAKLPQCRHRIKKPTCPHNRPSCVKKPPTETQKPDCPPQKPCPQVPAQYPYPPYWSIYPYPGPVNHPQAPQYAPHFPWPPLHQVQNLGQAQSLGLGQKHTVHQGQQGLDQGQGPTVSWGQGQSVGQLPAVSWGQGQSVGQGQAPIVDRVMGQRPSKIFSYKQPPLRHYTQQKQQWNFPRVASAPRHPGHGYTKLPFQSAWKWRY
ncbi:annexin B11-like [Gouania willdenowi]|uniref:annexin B11-like n=1 Tax=Gouania willdenowi TaxID=441366 RepID=UPI0010555D92|nr:annexin B11-like [Gouania willdenowi]